MMKNSSLFFDFQTVKENLNYFRALPSYYHAYFVIISSNKVSLFSMRSITVEGIFLVFPFFSFFYESIASNKFWSQQKLANTAKNLLFYCRC